MRRLYGVMEQSLQKNLPALLTALGGDPFKAKFAEMWRNWHEIVGDEIADCVHPLGADKKKLLLGVEDALVMQEMQYRKEEIREKVNAWLQNDYFETVHTSIMFGREGCGKAAPEKACSLEKSAAEKITGCANGIYLAEMDQDSAVAKAYALFAKKRQ